jgi:hypothetical protein
MGNTIDENGIPYDHNGELIKQIKRSDDYLYIYFNKMQLLVHRLMAYSKFGSKIYNKNMVVRHNNDIGLDNRYSNIEIGTRSDNWSDWRRLKGVGTKTQKIIE